ncbi:MAG: hypothetical protein JRS35_19560, partial [Deltaproteobacteria bacterium]|nr:hypothetical protein [Deltaproteobacteria bacterium]
MSATPRMPWATLWTVVDERHAEDALGDALDRGSRQAHELLAPSAGDTLADREGGAPPCRVVRQQDGRNHDRYDEEKHGDAAGCSGGEHPATEREKLRLEGLERREEILGCVAPELRDAR